jgi:hypothetical protein
MQTTAEPISLEVARPEDPEIVIYQVPKERSQGEVGTSLELCGRSS